MKNSASNCTKTTSHVSHPKKFAGVPFTRGETQLLRRAGFSEIQISYWKTGRHRPSLDNAKKIAAVTGRSLVEIIYCGPVWEEGESVI